MLGIGYIFRRDKVDLYLVLGIVHLGEARWIYIILLGIGYLGGGGGGARAR